MLWASVSDALAKIIRDGRGIHDAAQWEEIKAEAARWKPDGFDSNATKLRHQYEGKMDAQIKAATIERFKFTGHRMQPMPYNFAKLYAQNAAAVYDWPASRYLERVAADGAEGQLDSKDTDADAAIAREFDQMLTEAEIDVLMAEAERRVCLVQSGFLHVYSDSVESRATGKPPRTRVAFYWPDDVWVLPHPSNPTGLSSAIGFATRVAGSNGVNGSGECFQLWTRGYTEDEAGLPVEFTEWTVQKITTTVLMVSGLFGSAAKSETTVEDVLWPRPDGTMSATYPLPTLPFVAWYDGIPDGCPFLDGNRNLAQLFVTACTNMSSRLFTMDMNAASPMIRKTDVKNPTNIVMGPGVLTPIARDEDVIPVQLSADFDGIRLATTDTIALLAVTQRQRTDGYDIEAKGSGLSGVALKIKNEPQTKARIERVARAIKVEEQLLPIMIEVHDFYRGTSMGKDENVKPRMRPQDPPEYEDKDVTVRRVMSLRDAGLARDADVILAAGLARSKEEAERLADQLKKEREEKMRSDPRTRALLGMGNKPPQKQGPDDQPADQPEKKKDQPNDGEAVDG